MTRTRKPALTNSRKDPLGGVLVHLPQYGVVVCKHCRFAIQPGALSSHLQNHHILRAQRREILEELSTLTLLPPDQVEAPPSHAAPIATLPLLTGLKCIGPGCNYACTSPKRMSQHWSEIHGQPNSRLVEYRNATLQTFFMGNKIRYFEVSGPVDSDTWSQKQSRNASQRIYATSEPVSSPSSSLALSLDDPSPVTSEEIKPPDLDMPSLYYMHQFVLSGGFNLDRGSETPQFWTVNVLGEAYRHPFLMHAILGVAAMHMARSTSSADERRKHLHASSAYQGGSLPQFRAALAHPTPDNATAVVACARMLGIQDAMCDLLELEHTDREFVVSDILEHIALLRGCGDSLLQLQSLLPEGSGFLLPEHVAQGLQHFDDGNMWSMPALSEAIPARPAYIFNVLADKLIAADLLPAIDQPATAHAIHSLHAALALSYDPRDVTGWAIWNGAEGWMRSRAVQECVIPALAEGQPAAFVIIGLWAGLIIRRVEARHTWMRGLAHWFLLMCIRVSENEGVETLLKELLGDEMP